MENVLIFKNFAGYSMTPLKLNVTNNLDDSKINIENLNKELLDLFIVEKKCPNIKKYIKIGSGKSGTVYEIKWGSAKLYIKESNKTFSSINLNDNKTVLLKIVEPYKELKQRYSHSRQDKLVIENYINEFNNRCRNIYKYIVNSNYFGI